MNLKDKKVLFILANNFREEELFEPRRISESYNIKTFIASKDKVCKGVLGKMINVDFLFNQVNISDYDAIIFVGGPGSIIYWNDKNVLDIAKESYLKGKLTCSICLATGTLANSSIVKNHKVTGWLDTKDLVIKNSGIYTGNNIEVDGRIITALGPQYAKDFGEAIVKALSVNLTD